MTDDDGEARGTGFLKRRSSFSWSRTPADPREPADRLALVVPSDVVRKQETRLGDGILLPKICELLGVRDQDRVAEKIRVLSALQARAEKSASLGTRRKRITMLLRRIEAASDGAVDTLEQAARDDDAFFHSENGRVILNLLDAALRARECLENELAKLNPPRQGDNARVTDYSPADYFWINAELLWLEETFVQPHKRAEDYQRYRELLWEILTGEQGRSFAKAERRLRTQHRV
jgi:hypothetical protein